MHVNKSRLPIKIASVALAAGMVIASSAAWAGGGTRLEVRLSGDSLASGKAKWEQKGRRIKLSVEAEDLVGATATVMIACDSTISPDIAIVQTPQPGFFDLNLNSRVHNVPVCEVGDRVTVITDTGDMITGTFALK